MVKFIVIIVIVAIVAFLGYSWWQKNSSAIATEEIKRYARNMVENPDALKVTANSIKIINKNNASIGKISITGENIILKNGIELSSFILNINETAFAIPIMSKLTSVKSGYFKASVSEKAVTNFLRKKNLNLGFWKVSADTVTADIEKNKRMTITLPVIIPIIAKTKTIVVRGYYEIENNNINFIPDNMSISGMNISPGQFTQLFNAVKMMNPIVNFDKIPFAFKPQLSSTDTELIMKGNITGIR